MCIFLCVQMSPFHEDTSDTGLGPTLMNLILTWSSAKTLFPNQVPFVDTGIKTSASFGRGASQPLRTPKADAATSFLQPAVTCPKAAQAPRPQSGRPTPGRPYECRWTLVGGEWCGVSPWVCAAASLGAGGHLSNDSPVDPSEAPPLPEWTHDRARPQSSLPVYPPSKPHPLPPTCLPTLGLRNWGCRAQLCILESGEGPGVC